MTIKSANNNWFHNELSIEGTSNPPAIWLHGWGQTHTSLERLAGLIPGTHRLYDQPGFGATPPLSEEAATPEYANSIAAQMGDGRHIIIGHSFGCRVGLRLAHQHPEKVKALILIAGAGLRPKRSIKQKTRAFFLKMGSRGAGLCDQLFGTQLKVGYANRYGSADYKAAGILRTTFVKTVTEDLSEIAPYIDCPILLITGGQDTETPPYMAKRYESLLKNATAHVIEGYDHLDILSRGVYQCESLIKPFLERLEG